ncbi:MAG: signal peptidase I [Planctomycetes bacterium]|nr:signal peptidase I [Planctomycetota bacterium]
MTLNSDSRDAPVLPVTIPPVDSDRRGAVRSLCESLISLFVAVLLFRTFLAEGYMISTGSMAPCLLGFHKQVECPKCKQSFPFGVAYDTDAPDEADELLRARSRAVCPNCGQSGIDLSDVPRNHGDQLLVNKQAYVYRSPNRWEIIVFRNPAKPTEAYVKRVVGLPGEQLQVNEGDVYVDGRLMRKTYEQQRAMRILVHDHDHRPTRDPGFQPHWRPAVGDSVDPSESEEQGWQIDGNGFTLHEGNTRRPKQQLYQWVDYRHWIRSGGLHDTSVPLEEWPVDLEASKVPPVGLRYDPQLKTLSCTGAMAASSLKTILELNDDPPFQTALRQLYEESHVAPVTDNYGYNPVDGGAIPNPVRDVMLSCRIQIESGAGEFAVQMTDGTRNFTVILDAGHHEVRLLIGDSDAAVATGDWPPALNTGEPTLEVSVIDQQMVVAVDGVPIMQPWPVDFSPETTAPRSAVRFGGRGLDVHVDQLKLFRDVYYTSTRARNGVNRPYDLEDEEYFVMGDNSPVSHDSRRWDDAPVHRSLLLGKPFLVHLPSKPGRLRIGNYEMHLRIPDLARIRFLK